jgi:hypothetical protein
MTNAIVTSTYRYKRPPGKRKPVAIEGPRIVTPADPKKARRRVARKRRRTRVMELNRLGLGERRQRSQPRHGRLRGVIVQ